MSRKKGVKPLSPQQAFEMIETEPSAVLIDIRSSMEYLFVGHPKGAVHVPWIDEPNWTVDPNFSAHVRQVMLGGLSDTDTGNAPVILICRSGKRSLDAGEKLIKDGFPNVYHVDEGFEGELDKHHHRSTQGGWRYHELPWEQC